MQMIVYAYGFAASFSLNQFSEASLFINEYIFKKACGFELEWKWIWRNKSAN